jgi:hypothetical protein
MSLYPKAYFNWIRLKWEHNPSTAVEPWQVEDYRDLSTGALFDRLAALKLAISEENFLLMAEDYQSPEELTHYFWSKKENELPIYLILFELWRRLLPEKESLSVFCDELDNRIQTYLKDSQEDHGLSNALQRLQEILEESTELGDSPKAIFDALSRYVAHDLEGFLYDYISDQIDLRNDLEAAELLKTFDPYVSDTAWFDFLNARLLILVDLHEGDLAMQALLGKPLELDLLLEIATFLVHHGDPHLFQKAAQLALSQVQTEEDLQELMAIVADYCHCAEKEQEEEQIQSRFKDRLGKNQQTDLNPKDPDIIFLQKLLEN